MKQKFTLLIAVALVTALYTSCKKDATVTEKKQSTGIDQATLARKMATSLYKSFSTQFSSTGKAADLKVSGNAGCGLATITPTDITVINGDTTRKITGNAVLTTLCSENEWVVDAYTLHDTLKTVDTGTGFVNTYINTQYYNVKGPASEAMPIAGRITTGQNLRRFTPNGMTNEFHDLNMIYNFSSLVINPFATGNKFVMGKIDFTGQTVDLSPAIPTGYFSGYQGFIYYINNTARIYFRNTEVQGGYTRYIMDFATGQMSGPVNSYPFPVDM